MRRLKIDWKVLSCALATGAGACTLPIYFAFADGTPFWTAHAMWVRKMIVVGMMVGGGLMGAGVAALAWWVPFLTHKKRLEREWHKLTGEPFLLSDEYIDGVLGGLALTTVGIDNIPLRNQARARFFRAHAIASKLGARPTRASVQGYVDSIRPPRRKSRRTMN